MGEIRVAALYVQKGGCYFGLDDVDPWDEARDARLYAGPWPVVAHPPCKSWSIMGQCRPEIVRGEDGGCFEAALAAVREHGGVLEHPANTHAWRKFGLARPGVEGWASSLGDPGWTCEVDQFHYGHRANKRTWLYYVGPEPPAMDWSVAPRSPISVHNDGGGGSGDRRSKTPIPFRNILLDMARSAC